MSLSLPGELLQIRLVINRFPWVSLPNIIIINIYPWVYLSDTIESVRHYTNTSMKVSREFKPINSFK